MNLCAVWKKGIFLLNTSYDIFLSRSWLQSLTTVTGCCNCDTVLFLISWLLYRTDPLCLFNFTFFSGWMVVVSSQYAPGPGVCAIPSSWLDLNVVPKHTLGLSYQLDGYLLVNTVYLSSYAPGPGFSEGFYSIFTDKLPKGAFIDVDY